MRIVFRTEKKECPDCNKILKSHRTETRHIISIDNGIFTAVHRIRKCRKCGKLFRSESLDRMIEPYCTYANDIMIDVAMKRFIDGRSCGEISRESSYGISERQARNLSNDPNVNTRSLILIPLAYFSGNHVMGRYRSRTSTSCDRDTNDYCNKHTNGDINLRCRA